MVNVAHLRDPLEHTARQEGVHAVGGADHSDRLSAHRAIGLVKRRGRWTLKVNPPTRVPLRRGSCNSSARHEASWSRRQRSPS
jgi:hypothetical protein